MSKRLTIDDLLPSGRSDKFIIDQVKGKPKVKRNGKYIDEKQPTELYLNESELKKKGIEYLQKLKNCKVLKTDNMALRVGNGIKAKTRNPGMADHHLCIRGLFVAIEAKMPGESLNKDQIDYKRAIENALGIFIEYHSIWELETELLKNKLISRRTFIN